MVFTRQKDLRKKEFLELEMILTFISFLSLQWNFQEKSSKGLNIGIEHQVFLSDNDYLDGIKWRTSLDQTNNLDIGHYTHLVIGINLGNFDKVTEPLYWMNPIDAAFNDIANLKSQPQLDLADEDQDGVIDMMDMELDTPDGCPVDTRGVLLDSDGDGMADCEDKEPYSRPGCPVDEFGIADCADECCTDEEQINKLIDAKAEELRNSMMLDSSTPLIQSGTIGETTGGQPGTTTGGIAGGDGTTDGTTGGQPRNNNWWNSWRRWNNRRNNRRSARNNNWWNSWRRWNNRRNNGRSTRNNNWGNNRRYK